MKQTIVINAYGGPGSGKTTACFYIACELKKMDFIVEYVPEYSKELVWEERWDMLDGSVESQKKILAEQKRRLDRLLGKVDFIVTDAPLLLNRIYLNDTQPNSNYMKELLNIYYSYNNFNFFVKRDDSKFESAGRIQNLEESKVKDREILELLKFHKIYYGEYTHSRLNYLISNVVTTHNRINVTRKPT